MSVKNIVDNLMEGIKFYINEKLKTASYDRTDTAIVKGISEFGYVISYNNTLYSDVKTTGGTCSINETVKIVIPQNNINNIFILKGADITTLEENFINKNKITNSGVINVDGYVVDAKQLNPNINNTLAWNVNQLNSNLTELSEKIILNGTTQFLCGYDHANNIFYIRGYINATDYYQIQCNSNSITFAKSIDGQWSAIWTK